MAVWRLQVNTGGANVADYCLQNHVAALGGWQGTCYGAFTEDIVGVLDAVDTINKELRIHTGFINDTGKELPTIIAFEDIIEIEVNMT